MKRPIKLTILLMSMFIITQLIGLYVINFYISDGSVIPYGFDQKQIAEQTPNFGIQVLASFITSFIIAILIIFFFMRINARWIIKLWFFTVVAIALAIFFNVLLIQSKIMYSTVIALAIGLVLAFFKMFKPNPIIHNLTELLIYPGIASIFVVMLNWWVTIILLILISIYDIWAVWHSKFMVKMANFQIKNIGVLGGFMIPYASKKMKEKIKLLKIKYKNSKIPQSAVKKNKIKVALAILGGGDVVYPLIAAGVFLKTFGLIPAFCVTAGASLALLYLLSTAEKQKGYPAMPYLTVGIFLGMIVGYVLTLV